MLGAAGHLRNPTTTPPSLTSVAALVSPPSVPMLSTWPLLKIAATASPGDGPERPTATPASLTEKASL